MQIVDTSLIFKKRCVDLEENTFKSQKGEFYEAWLANFGPFFSNLGLLKARSPSNLVMNNSWCPPILPHFFSAFLGQSVSDLEKRKQKNCREKTLPWPARQHWVKNLWRLRKDFIIPAASLRSLAVFVSLIPLELSADTFMMYMVRALKPVCVVLFIE